MIRFDAGGGRLLSKWAAVRSLCLRAEGASNGDQNDQVVFGWPSVEAGLRVCLGYEAGRRTTAAELRFSGIGRFESATPLRV